MSCWLRPLLILLPLFPLAHAADLRVGLIGLDTSHATAFTEILNNPAAKDHVAGARVVAAFQGGSPDLKESWSRVPEYTQTLTNQYGVKLYDTIEAMCAEVDAVMLESVDGRPHLEQAKAVFAAHKPLYIDKPVAGTLRDAIEIFRLAQAANMPVFTASSLRYGRATQAVRSGSIGTVTNALCWSPAHLEPHHPDLFWYGVHGCESLFTVMGTGCESVHRRPTADGKIEVTGTWTGGRIGVFREDDKGYGGHAQGTKGEAAVGNFDGYAPLVAEVVKFFQTRQPPVSAAETLELFAFMEAADESQRQHGAEIRLADVRAKAAK
jgi:predicted dehydrogenase